MAGPLYPQNLPPVDPSEIDPITGFLKSENPQFTPGAAKTTYPQPSLENATNKLKQLGENLGFSQDVQPGWELRGPQAAPVPQPSQAAPAPNTKLDLPDFTGDTRTPKTASTPETSANIPGYGTGTIDQAMKAGDDKAIAEVREAETREVQANKMVEEARVRENMVKEAGDAAIRDFESTKNEIANFKFQDYWENQSTGQKIMAGIAIALGGIGQAAGGGSNKAIEVIDKSIQKDLELQKLNYNRMKDKGEATKGLYSMYMQKYNNEQMASNATYAALVNASTARLDQVAAPYENAKTKVQYQMLKNQLGEIGLAKTAAMRQAAELQAGFDSGKVNMRNLTPEQVHQWAKFTGDKEFPERYVGGYGAAYSKEDKKAFMDVRKVYEPAISGAERVLELSKNLNRVTDRAQLAKIKTELIALKGQLREPFTGPGAMREEEYQRLGEAIGDPAKLMALPSWERVKLQTVLNKLRSDFNQSAVNAGLTPAVKELKIGRPTK